MISVCKFGKIESANCFEDGVTNILYFPIVDSGDFPQEISDKTGRIIERMIHAYEVGNNYTLDLSKLCINARIVAFMDKKGEWINEIAVVISDIDGKSDIWIEENYSINLGNHLYEPFKRYFMGQIERNLFHG